MSESIWEKNTAIPKRNRLERDMRTDVCIIGAGMAGILAGYMLQKQGYEVIILEAARIGSGQTRGTTAKITSQHGLIYSRLCRNFGSAGAWQYALANESAIDSYEQVIHEEHISCDFKRCASYLYTQKSPELLEEEAEAARICGIPARLTKDIELPMDVSSGLEFPNQASFHPLKFLYALSKKLTVYENSEVIDVSGRSVKTEHGKVWAKHIIFACHFPFVNMPGYYFMRLYQERSYILALKQAINLENYYYGIDSDGLSFRSAGDNLLISGGNHRTGARLTESPYRLHTETAAKLWPDAFAVAQWSAQDCMSPDGVPYIGHFARKKQNWYVATGFGKWGMSSSMVSAKILSNLISGHGEIRQDIFYPRRELCAEAMIGYLKNGLHTVKDFSKYLIPKPRKVCTHLGCPLTWNPEEETYECPCHGSRFDSEGHLMSGPARKNLHNR